MRAVRGKEPARLRGRVTPWAEKNASVTENITDSIKNQISNPGGPTGPPEEPRLSTVPPKSGLAGKGGDMSFN